MADAPGMTSRARPCARNFVTAAMEQMAWPGVRADLSAVIAAFPSAAPAMIRHALRSLAPLLLATALAAQEPPPPPAPTGIVFGTVLNDLSRPVLGADVVIVGSALATRTGPDGRFLLDGVAPGVRQIMISREGYLMASAEIRVVADSGTEVAVHLVPDGQRLPGVVIEADISNTLMGMVVDGDDRPLAGVTVSLLGLGREVVTGEDGRFVFHDVRTGDWLMQVRKPGHVIMQRGVRMLPGLERNLSIRLASGENERMSVALAEVVANELGRRQSMRGGRAAVVGRDELAKWDRAPLDVALAGTSGGNAFREAGGACVLVDGHEVANTMPAFGASLGYRQGRGYAPTSIDPEGTAGSGSAMPGSTVSHWLRFFRANDVEMVEIFPRDTDYSQTLCGRFPPSSGCSCPPNPAGIVIWLRK